MEGLQLHRDSRRGLDGVRGEQGLPGRDSTVVGPQGPAGRDADVTQVVEAALKKVKEEFDQEYAVLAQVVRHALVTGGVLDENGNAILIPGPTGAPGADSQVAGPAGRDGVDGKSIVGPAGRDAKIAIGSVTVGSEASASLREHENGQVLDLVIPRAERGEQGLPGKDGADSTVPGVRGEIGPEGIRGLPGEGLSKAEVIEIIRDMKRRGSI